VELAGVGLASPARRCCSTTARRSIPRGDVLFDSPTRRDDHFGTSAKYIDALRKAGLEPAGRTLSAGCAMILSTGSPLAPESFDYVYAA
jgi:acetoacetyl-CoA synthetase